MCHGTALLERNKRNVVAYYTRAFNDKEPEDAVDRYVGFDEPGRTSTSRASRTSTSSTTRSRRAALPRSSTSSPSRRRFPEVHIDIRRVVAECDLVVTHGLATGAELVFTALGSKVVDIFRLDEHGKIVEHWDVLAPISPTSANGNPEV